MKPSPLALGLVVLTLACARPKSVEPETRQPAEPRAAPPAQPTPPPLAAPSDPVAWLVKAADVGTDPAFAALLAAHKHAADRVAPRVLRELLAALAPTRLEWSEAFEHTDGAPVLVFFVPQLGIPGKPADAQAKLAATLGALGFGKPQTAGGPRGRPEEVYTRALGQATLALYVEEIQPYTGARTPTSGTTLLLKVRANEPTAPPALRTVLAARPSLRDARVPAALVDLVSGDPVASVASGGTWARYYTWDVRLLAADGAGAGRLLARVQQRLTALGFQAEPTDSVLVYGKDGARVTLSSQGASVELHVQPES